jgi:hypothetical protein
MSHQHVSQQHVSQQNISQETISQNVSQQHQVSTNNIPALCFREFVEQLKKDGDLAVIDELVDAHLEIGAITRKVLKMSLIFVLVVRLLSK